MNPLLNLKTTIEAFDKKQKIAFICSPKLGDTLIFLVTVNNFLRNGFTADVYGDYAYALKSWFPWVNIMPNIPAVESKTLDKYPLVLHMYPSDLSRELDSWHPNSIVLSASNLYKLPTTLADIQVEVCRQLFGLKNLARENNIIPLTNLVHRKYLKRIIIHPTSAQIMRNWPAKKFIKLSNLLENEGYLPQFIISAEERKEWKNLVDEKKYLPCFSGLSDVASFIYESGWFIGNDSGIGHLASNLQIPTLSLILRPSLARQWRPSWSQGLIVLPPPWLITRPLKEKFWKKFISVKKVYEKFHCLVDTTFTASSNVN